MFTHTHVHTQVKINKQNKNKITHCLTVMYNEGGGQEEEWYSETKSHKQEESKDGECARINA